MKEFEQIQVENRPELRAWLSANYVREESIWLVTFKKHVAGKYVPWDDVVEEALSFGWIDSLPRKLDEERTMLLLSPRRPGSPWSRINKQRAERLMEEGLMMPPGQAAIEAAKADGSWTVYDEIEDLVIPADLGAALKQNEPAAANFEAFNDSAKKPILWWIKSAKKADTRRKRIAETVQLAEHNIRANHPEAREFKRQQALEE